MNPLARFVDWLRNDQGATDAEVRQAIQGIEEADR